MKWFYLNVALTYVTIGFASAIFIFYVLKRPILGHFWGALIIGLIGSFLGGAVASTRAAQRLFLFLAEFNDVNVFAAGGCSLLLIWTLSRLSSPK
jgi:hypothetical protein